MTKNTLGDLHNLLMEQMETLITSDGKEAKIQIEKARAAADLSTSIVNNARIIMQCAKMNAAQQEVSGLLGIADE